MVHRDRARASRGCLSDLLVIAVPVAGLLDRVCRGAGQALWQDTAVILEAYAINTSGDAREVRRATSPSYVYDPGLSAQDGDTASAQLSFYSGHTATAFVAAVAFSEVFRRRHDGIEVHPLLRVERRSRERGWGSCASSPASTSYHATCSSARSWGPRSASWSPRSTTAPSRTRDEGARLWAGRGRSAALAGVRLRRAPGSLPGARANDARRRPAAVGPDARRLASPVAGAAPIDSCSRRARRVLAAGRRARSERRHGPRRGARLLVVHEPPPDVGRGGPRLLRRSRRSERAVDDPGRGRDGLHPGFIFEAADGRRYVLRTDGADAARAPDGRGHDRLAHLPRRGLPRGLRERRLLPPRPSCASTRTRRARTATRRSPSRSGTSTRSFGSPRAARAVGAAPRSASSRRADRSARSGTEARSTATRTTWSRTSTAASCAPRPARRADEPLRLPRADHAEHLARGRPRPRLRGAPLPGLG